MKIYAIICEYNPFHYGHEYLISKIKESDGDAVVISLMSGNFTQRGLPALSDKYNRAENALRGGADIVLELPYPYSCGSARNFARSAVELLSDFGCVDALCFGSEAGEVEPLAETAQRLLSEDFASEMKKELKGSYNSSAASKLQLVYSKLYGAEAADILNGSNNILALEYMKALIETESKITPVTVRRDGNLYNGGGSDENGNKRYSASEIRNSYVYGGCEAVKGMVPDYTLRLLRSAEEEKTVASLSIYYALLAYKLAVTPLGTAPAETPAELLSRMKNAAAKCADITAFAAAARDKKFSESRVLRSALYTLTETEKFNAPSFTCLLAANEKGRRALSVIKKHTSVPILTKPASAREFEGERRESFLLSSRADTLYALLCGADPSYYMKRAPFIR